MNRRSKLIAFIAPLTLAILALSSYAYIRAHASPTYRLANGIEVTPAIDSVGNTDELLEIKRWDIDIVRPNVHKPLYVSFVLYGGGKVLKIINGGFSWTPGTEHPAVNTHGRTHLSLALLPLGDSFFGAEQIKYSLDTGEGTISSTMPNPFLKGHGLSTGTQVVPADDVILLLSTNRTKSYISGNMADNDTNLALSLTETPPR